MGRLACGVSAADRQPPLTFLLLLCTIRNGRKPPRRRGPVSAPCSNEICACDGIGRHARFRFSCSNACGFESLQAHHKKGHDVSRVLFCGLRGPKARSALRDFNARGGRAAPAPRFSPAVKTLVRRTCAAAQKGRLAVLLQRFRPSKISILTAPSMTSVLIAFEKL